MPQCKEASQSAGMSGGEALKHVSWASVKLAMVSDLFFFLCFRFSLHPQFGRASVRLAIVVVVFLVASFPISFFLQKGLIRVDRTPLNALPDCGPRLTIFSILEHEAWYRHAENRGYRVRFRVLVGCSFALLCNSAKLLLQRCRAAARSACCIFSLKLYVP